MIMIRFAYIISFLVLLSAAFLCSSCGRRINANDSISEKNEKQEITNEEKIKYLVDHLKSDRYKNMLQSSRTGVIDSVKVDVLKPQILVSIYLSKYPQSWNGLASKEYVDAEQRKEASTLRLWSHGAQPGYKSIPQYQSFVALAEDGMEIKFVQKAIDGSTIEYVVDPNLVLSDEDI